MRRRISLAGIVLAAVLASPQLASASIIDFIWEMSGPQMIGVPIYCDIDLRTDEKECRIGGIRLPSPKLTTVEKAAREREDYRAFRATRTFWLSMQGGVFASTTKDSDMSEFEAWKVQMLSWEPMLGYRSFSSASERFVIDHGLAGVSYFILFGSDFKRFHNVGFKFTPIGVTYRWVNVSYNVRLFPSGFTSEQFNVDGSSTTHRGREILTGFSVGFLFPPVGKK
jgi:hypothetical protein